MEREFYLRVIFKNKEVEKKLEEVEEAIGIIRTNMGWLADLTTLEVSSADQEGPTL